MTRSDLLVINKIDLAPNVGADLDVMARDAAAIRGGKPVIFTNLKLGEGLDKVIEWIRRTCCSKSPNRPLTRWRDCRPHGRRLPAPRRSDASVRRRPPWNRTASRRTGGAAQNRAAISTGGWRAPGPGPDTWSGHVRGGQAFDRGDGRTRCPRRHHHAVRIAAPGDGRRRPREARRDADGMFGRTAQLSRV